MPSAVWMIDSSAADAAMPMDCELSMTMCRSVYFATVTDVVMEFVTFIVSICAMRMRLVRTAAE